MTPITDTIVIRRAGAADARVLARIAALDSARIPSADSLIAELGGLAVAALDLADGHVVADPFAPTADVVELLRLRASRVRGPHAGRSHRAVRVLARRPRPQVTARA
jgi:hypothetical protein